ncbi:MAG: hypothetical protein V4713_05310 [Pseudomonadota bacterium]
MACCLLISSTMAFILAIKVRLLGGAGGRHTQALVWRLTKEEKNDPA